MVANSPEKLSRLAARRERTTIFSRISPACKKAAVAKIRRMLYNEKEKSDGTGGVGMELLFISDSKLKVMLTEEDMRRYDLNAEKVDYDNTETRRAFWEILDEAKHRTGFDAASDKVLIQLYPSRDGGCELFVTKLGLIPPLAEKTIAKSNRVTMLAARRGVYAFGRVADLILASRAVAGAPSVRESDAYFADDGRYYLLVEERGGKNEGVDGASRLLEYGESVPTTLADYIREHGACLAEKNAISRFAALVAEN